MKRKSSGLVQTHYGLACQQCGESVPGNEDWDWCDHINGYGCPWNHEDDYDSSDDYEYEADLDDEPCARCGLPTSERDDIGKPLCHSCYVELTMTQDE